MSLRQIQGEPCVHILEWEKIEADVSCGRHSYRCPLPGGWLIRLVNTNAHPNDTDHLFINDPEHKWGTPEFDEVPKPELLGETKAKK